jgi:hypothetical protein
MAWRQWRSTNLEVGEQSGEQHDDERMDRASERPGAVMVATGEATRDGRWRAAPRRSAERI